MTVPTGVLDDNRAPTRTQGKPVFFPNGIELISLEVKVGQVDISLKVAGPKAESKTAK